MVGAAPVNAETRPDAMNPETKPSLLLQIEGQSWPLRDGDVVGRLGTVGGGVLKRYDVLSREHLKVVQRGGSWQVMMMPKASNETLLNGVPLTPGVLEPLPPGSEVVVDSLRMRFRQEGAAPVPTMVVPAATDEYPAGLVVLDESLAVQSCNEFGVRLFDPKLEVGSNFAEGIEAASRPALRQALSHLQEHRASEEMVFRLAAHGRSLGMVFQRVGHQFHGVLRDQTRDASRKQTAQEDQARISGRLKVLETILLSRSFRAGDLMECLPRLAHHAATLLSNATCSLWIEQPEGKYRCSARAGGGAVPTVGMVGEAKAFQAVDDFMESDPSEVLRDQELVEPEGGEVLIQPCEGAAAVFQKQGEDEWTDEQCAVIELLAVLFQQVVTNSKRPRAT